MLKKDIKKHKQYSEEELIRIIKAYADNPTDPVMQGFAVVVLETIFRMVKDITKAQDEISMLRYDLSYLERSKSSLYKSINKIRLSINANNKNLRRRCKTSS